jgi:hypothetical protein
LKGRKRTWKKKRKRSKEGEDNDEEQGGVSSKKIVQVLIFIYPCTFADQKTITPSRLLAKGLGLKAGKISTDGSSSTRSCCFYALWRYCE